MAKATTQSVKKHCIKPAKGSTQRYKQAHFINKKKKNKKKRKRENDLFFQPKSPNQLDNVPLRAKTVPLKTKSNAFLQLDESLD